MIRDTATSRGFTLVEVLVAVVLLSLVGLAVASTMLATQRTQRTSAQWMRAVQLAADGIERLRGGQAMRPCPDGFACSGYVTPGNDSVVRIAVSVDWYDGAPRRYYLMTLAQP